MIHIVGLKCVSSDMRVMGANSDTVKIESNGISFMKFHAKDFIEELRSWGNQLVEIEIVGRANLNNWMGQITPQIFIEDYEIKKAYATFEF